MKQFGKLFAILLLLFVVCDKTQAQSYAKYRRIPIKGKVESFCGKLEKLGLQEFNDDSVKEILDSDYVYVGEYLERLMFHAVKCDKVGNVEMLVLYYFCDDPSLAQSEYKIITGIFNLKYGEPDSGYDNSIDSGIATWVFDNGSVGIRCTENSVIIAFTSPKYGSHKIYSLSKQL